MASTMNESEMIEAVLADCADRYSTEDARRMTVFDRERGHFLVIEEGGIGSRRIYTPLVHIERCGAEFWIQQDCTSHGIAHDLAAQGVSWDRIVLAYQPPTLRVQTERAAM